MTLQMPAGKPALTADLIARAIVAAAQSYGDDPVRALTSKSPPLRRCLSAATGGISLLMEVRADVIAPVLGVGQNTVTSARCRQDERFRAAERAAERAARYAGWRPEARESIVAGLGIDVVQAEPPMADSMRRLTTRTAFAAPVRKMSIAKAAATPSPAAKTVTAVSEADMVHLAYIRAGNGGRGFPAPVAR